MTTQAVKRACDACHRRKVKCDGINPCRNCSSAQLSCTYNAIPQKKGPKGSRAKVISELRETQRQTSLSAKVQNRMNGIASPPGSPGANPTPGLLNGEMVKECLDFFFANMYQNMPIIDRRQVESQILFMEQNKDAYCLITALCAFVMLQPGMTMPAGDPFNLDIMPGANLVSSTLLLEEVVRVRGGYEYLDAPTLNSLATSYFIFACYNGVESHGKAWYYLREATTMIHMVGMNKEEAYAHWDAVEASRRRRLFWLLFATERAYAIQRQRPLTLQATINPPTLTDDPTDPLAQQLDVFISLVNAFRPFDDALTAVWNKTRGSLPTSYIAGLQKQLSDVLPSYHCQDAQLADLSTNQQWLKSTSWQLTGEDQGISFQFPVEFSRELLMTFASQFPGQGAELMGMGLVEKLVEVAYATTSILSLKPASRDPFTAGPREHLGQILNIVAVLRNGDHRFLPLLLTKVSDALPRQTSPMLQNAPENTNLNNVDIFDGFGNAGMAQPPPQMHMSMDTYDRKYSLSVSEMHGNPSESGVNSSAPMTSLPSSTSPDGSSTFVSSPAVMSPGVDFSHGMSDYGCTPMSDMVISPLAGPGTSASINPQQTQHLGISTLQSQCLNQQIQGGIGHGLGQGSGLGGHHQQGMGNQMSASHTLGSTGAILGTMARQPPQRANSFVMQGQQASIPHTVGDFQALQRTNSDSSQPLGALAGMGMGAEMSFGLR